MTRSRILILCALLFAAAAGGQKIYAAGVAKQQRPLAGYTVSGVRYELGSTGSLRSLGFTLAPAARRVRVRISTHGSWLPCTVSGPRVACPLGVSAPTLQSLAVDAS